MTVHAVSAKPIASATNIARKAPPTIVAANPAMPPTPHNNVHATAPANVRHPCAVTGR